MVLRRAIRAKTFADENIVLTELLAQSAFSDEDRKRVATKAAALVQDIRKSSDPSLMELFLGEYGLSSEEGVALMCLAEALLRVPDVATIDDLIEDKIVPSAWSAHLGQSHSPMINASTWALMLTGRVLDDAGDGVTATLRRAIKRLGEPVIRTAVGQAMKEMGRQFVLGETIDGALDRARGMEAKGFTYSYDMLGEAARTETDARRYHMAYAEAIAEIAKAAKSDSVEENPGISIKLSALHPRYEPLQRARIMSELTPRVASLVTLAKSAGIGLNIDAEEADRLDLSLDVIDAVLSDPALSGWDGFGVVVQAYSKRAASVLDWLNARAKALDRRIMVRLVKGAYWDTEIKRAQVDGLPDYPVFTRKAATDVSYLACAKRLFEYSDTIYPQFATHNAHTVAAVLDMAPKGAAYEFQRLHGMGESLHARVLETKGTRCRIYAPVGAHKDLLAYLVRRLLENGANSSFVNQLVDEDVAPETVAADPIKSLSSIPAKIIVKPAELFLPSRLNSSGFDLSDPEALSEILNRRSGATKIWGGAEPSTHAVHNPATGTIIGHVRFVDAQEAEAIADTLEPWPADVEDRAAVLNAAADLYEQNWPELFALLSQEAGKTLIDCIGELREAVDFLRYYAEGAKVLEGQPLGTVLCISPWNFPLAIFTGQIAAALAAGNAVIAKPAETTSLIATRAVELLHQAGVPEHTLTLIPGEGSKLGPVLCRHSKTEGVAFTGSTATGQAINRELAAHQPLGTPLVAETGGINAMIVDSSALLEQAIGDIVASAFQSAGQRCSALRVLYVQSDVADALEEMLLGAMDALIVGDPEDPATDVGPVIDAAAKKKISKYVEAASAAGRLIKQIEAPTQGTFVGPAVIRVNGIDDVREEIFGPVLHIARFEAGELDAVIDKINAPGFGLTFGLHTRIDGRVQKIVDRVDVGNIYVNRNQIGAVVGSQPFGGHNLSGTGPKAGGPRYLSAFTKRCETEPQPDEQQLPGPTGETNSYKTLPRHGVFCAGPGIETANAQADLARSQGCSGIVVEPDAVASDLSNHANISVVLHWGGAGSEWATACAERAGPIVKLVLNKDAKQYLTTEQSICIDTTASGGNAELLAATS